VRQEDERVRRRRDHAACLRLVAKDGRKNSAAIGQMPLGAFCAKASVGTISTAVYNVRMKRMSPPILRGRRISVATNAAQA
jgi:hypothetical protein